MKNFFKLIKDSIHNMNTEYSKALQDTHNGIMWTTDSQGHMVPVHLHTNC